MRFVVRNYVEHDRTGDVIAVRHHFRPHQPSSYLSLAIRELDDCWANHSAIIVYINGHRYVMEARGGGMFLSTWTEWLNNREHKSFKILRPTFELPENIQSRCLAKAGKKYDLTGLLFWHPWRLLTGRWKGGTSEDGRFVCSELIGWIYKEQHPNWRYLTTGMIMESGLYREIQHWEYDSGK